MVCFVGRPASPCISRDAGLLMSDGQDFVVGENVGKNVVVVYFVGTSGEAL